MSDNYLSYCNYKMRVEELDGVQYYVLRRNMDSHGNEVTIDNSEYYQELWINKDNMLIYKFITDTRYSAYEVKYTWEIGNVTDEDVKLKDLTDEQLEQVKEKFYRLWN